MHKEKKVGCIIMRILDLYLKGVASLPDDDLITAGVNYLCEKYNMTTRTDMALDQLNHIIDATISSVKI